MEEQMSSKWRKADKGYPGPDTLSTRTRPNQMREREKDGKSDWLELTAEFECRFGRSSAKHTLTYFNSHWHWAQLRWFADASWFSVSSTYSQMDRKAPPTYVSEWATDWMNKWSSRVNGRRWQATTIWMANGANTLWWTDTERGRGREGRTHAKSVKQ